MKGQEEEREKMSLFSNLNINPENPAGDGGQSGRIDDIKASFAAGEITQEQYDDLMGDEAVTSNYIFKKRVALALLCAGIAFLTLW